MAAMWPTTCRNLGRASGSAGARGKAAAAAWAAAALFAVACGAPAPAAPSDDVSLADAAGDAQLGADSPGDAAPDTGCSKGCDDGNACTVDSCQNAACRHDADLTAAKCDDGNPCTAADACVGAACVGKALDCDDKNPCTVEMCDATKGCVYTVDDGPACDDGDGCTPHDTCAGGKCGSGAALTCDDGKACTTDSCDPKNGCSFVENNAPCSDGNACTSGDTCADGKCSGGKAKACGDDNPCTDDKCEAKSGVCVFLPNQVTCDDGAALTHGDACFGGLCSGTPGCGCSDDAGCDDNNPCTKDVCTAGCCISAALAGSVSCTDGNSCTLGDSCDGGTCIGGAKQKCDDGNPCSDDACVPGLGCVYAANGAACDDGLACSGSDVCMGGVCVGNVNGCMCSLNADCNDGNPCSDEYCVSGTCAVKPSGAGKACQDGNACTVGDTCAGGSCLGGAESDCADGNPCSDDLCDPTSGKCVHSPNLAGCDDGDGCTASGHCQGGACQAGKAIDCDDGSACTTDACVAASPGVTGGCVHLPSAASCSDDNACTGADTCVGAACIGIALAICDDGNACTADGCSPGAKGSDSKVCAHALLSGACDDGDACTSGDSCLGVVCAGAATSCDDENACTKDACAGDGTCQHEASAAACSDGNACTVGDTCLSGGCVGGSALGCDDGDGCTADACDLASGCTHTVASDGTVCEAAGCAGLLHSAASTCLGGLCVPGTQKGCDDGNGCSDDACEAASGCSHSANAAACSDDNVCTSGDVCAGGACLPGAVTSCDDGNLCSVDSCDPIEGCGHTAATDGTICATQGCSGLSFGKGGACLAGSCALFAAAVSCDDGNVCTADLCSPSVGCNHQANTAPCADGNPCTSNDTCALGICEAGGPNLCSDDNICTDDVCSAIAGCTHTNNQKPCDDGSVCSAGDACSAGACGSGGAIVCADNNPCTNEACDPLLGCVFANNTLPCDDGSQCTSGDVCAGGKCGSAVNPCDDGNACTQDACDGLGGCSHPPLGDGSACSAAACDDLSFFAAAVCTAGVCGGAPAAVACGDGNPCTTDLCNAASGCLHPQTTAACNDGDACTTGDACVGGNCVGAATSCSDGGVCSVALGCDVTLGCQYAATTGSACSDGNACTDGDTCAAGSCVGGDAANCDDNNACTSDACDPAQGCVWTALATGDCSDGNVCTGTALGPDKCANGSCLGGTAVACDDKNPCTNDSCDPTLGCKTANNAGACTDGNACTKNDVCAGGACQPGGATVCDDGNPCSVDSCDSELGCGAKPVADGSACGSGACDGVKYTAAGTCTNGQCVVPVAKTCDDGIDCTIDSCVAATGCVATAKPWGSACTPAAGSALYYPFCAATTCTGLEVKVGGPTAATFGVLSSIDRNGGGIVASGWDYTLGLGNTQGDVRSVNETNLALAGAGDYLVAKSRMNDVRDVLAVGGIGDNVPILMSATAGSFAPMALVASPKFSRTFYAVDAFASAGGETFVFGGGGDSASEFRSNVGRVARVGTTFGAVSRMVITTSPTLCDAQVAMTVNDVYAASDADVYFVGSIGKNGQNPTQSAVAVWDGTATTGCDGLEFTYSGEIYVNTPTSSVDRLAPIGSGVGQGVYRAVHGTSATHLLLGGTAGTLWSFDGGIWTQQTPSYLGMPVAWSSAFDVKSVHLAGSDGWAAGEWYTTDIAGATCRRVFVLHGSFDSSGGVWSWNKLIVSPDLSTCGAAIASTQASKIWVDATTGAVYVVGSFSGKELVARIKLP